MLYLLQSPAALLKNTIFTELYPQQQKKTSDENTFDALHNTYCICNKKEL
jgi:hypothetical protein